MEGRHSLTEATSAIFFSIACPFHLVSFLSPSRFASRALSTDFWPTGCGQKCAARGTDVGPRTKGVSPEGIPRYRKKRKNKWRTRQRNAGGMLVLKSVGGNLFFLTFSFYSTKEWDAVECQTLYSIRPRHAFAITKKTRIKNKAKLECGLHNVNLGVIEACDPRPSLCGSRMCP